MLHLLHTCSNPLLRNAVEIEFPADFQFYDQNFKICRNCLLDSLELSSQYITPYSHLTQLRCLPKPFFIVPLDKYVFRMIYVDNGIVVDNFFYREKARK